MIDRVEFVSLLRVVPDAGVNDDAGAVRDGRIRDADLGRRIFLEIIRCQGGGFRKAQPFAAGSAADLEALADVSAVGKGRIAVLQADLTCVNAGAGRDEKL